MKKSSDNLNQSRPLVSGTYNAEWINSYVKGLNDTIEKLEDERRALLIALDIARKIINIYRKKHPHEFFEDNFLESNGKNICDSNANIHDSNL